MPERVPSVAFVCVGNSCRSQMAEGFARALGAGRVAAYSAGSQPAGRVHPAAIRLMAEKGVDLGRHTPKGIDELPAIPWDYVVTMGCGDACARLAARHRLDWDLPDPQAMDDDAFRAVRDRIERLVRDLLDAAARTSGSAGGQDR